MKTLLFDIDGTLLVTNETGTRALAGVLRNEFQVECPNMEVQFGGRTDRSLLQELMLLNDIPPSETNYVKFTDAYRALLPETLSECGGVILPGVTELLTRLSKRNDLRTAVMTGNLKVTATQKLSHFRLLDYFDDIFGGDFDADRRHLAKRTSLFLRGTYGDHLGDDTIVIGDTPADVLCGLEINASVMGVCTGRFDRQSLLDAGAHVVHQDLSNVETVYDWLTR